MVLRKISKETAPGPRCKTEMHTHGPDLGKIKFALPPPFSPLSRLLISMTHSILPKSRRLNSAFTINDHIPMLEKKSRGRKASSSGGEAAASDCCCCRRAAIEEGDQVAAVGGNQAVEAEGGGTERASAADRSAPQFPR